MMFELIDTPWKEAWNKTGNICGDEWFETAHLPERKWSNSKNSFDIDADQEVDDFIKEKIEE